MTDFSQAVTDAVSQINSLVVGSSPAMSLASQYQTQGFNTTMAAMNAVHSQQQSCIVHQTATVENVIKMLRS
ncbi:RebB family R body protein [Desulfoluna spongiiphila]|uniref:Killing trait domain-containing protein n=1 Tax=Desulfoluna spongiiphila TaxID=419481 RepID=A0A1G5DM07_9BACT|nr:RebB family R body protein [Desulfoluna spongiiphila]SCY15694.1 Killing trait domain-containing protein [Desulfoluna spongiiphila]VVS95057.1 killing trait rebb [Desulfoluna spongiiphila]